MIHLLKKSSKAVSQQSKRKKHDLFFSLDEYKRTKESLSALDAEMEETSKGVTQIDTSTQQVAAPKLPDKDK